MPTDNPIAGQLARMAAEHAATEPRSPLLVLRPLSIRQWLCDKPRIEHPDLRLTWLMVTTLEDARLNRVRLMAWETLGGPNHPVVTAPPGLGTDAALRWEARHYPAQ